MQTNALIDILDRFAGNQATEGSWLTAVKVFAEMGYDWVTFGQYMQNCGPAIRTTVSKALMADYAAAGLFDNDNWLRHCARSHRIDDLAVGSASPDDVGYPVQEVLGSHGVQHATLIPCSHRAQAAGLVVYARDVETRTKLTSREGTKELRLVTAVVSSALNPTVFAPNLPGYYGKLRHLSPREADTLRWLSVGLDTEAIAVKMNLAPVTVTKHLASAKRRLNAKTREQALAIALTLGLIGL